MACQPSLQHRVNVIIMRARQRKQSSPKIQPGTSYPAGLVDRAQNTRVFGAHGPTFGACDERCGNAWPSMTSQQQHGMLPMNSRAASSSSGSIILSSSYGAGCCSAVGCQCPVASKASLAVGRSEVSVGLGASGAPIYDGSRTAVRRRPLLVYQSNDAARRAAAAAAWSKRLLLCLTAGPVRCRRRRRRHRHPQSPPSVADAGRCRQAPTHRRVGKQVRGLHMSSLLLLTAAPKQICAHVDDILKHIGLYICRFKLGPGPNRPTTEF